MSNLITLTSATAKDPSGAPVKLLVGVANICEVTPVYGPAPAPAPTVPTPGPGPTQIFVGSNILLLSGNTIEVTETPADIAIAAG